LAVALDPTEDIRKTRMVSNNGYQYKYNGKEWQDELGLNMYDYGARNYEPAIGRWLNIDPLAEKFTNTSPYNYTSNNPVFFVDYDGKDYGVYIDHKNKTIKYKANYYFNNHEDLKSNIESLLDWTSLNGTYVNSDGLEYSVSFELNASVAENGENAEQLAENDPIGNAIIELNDVDFANKYNEKGKAIGKEYNDNFGGVTWNSKIIYNRKSVANKQTRSHEIGHTFGEDDSPNQVGVMAYSSSFNNMSNVTTANGRKILKRDYKDMKRNNLNTPTLFYNGIRTIEIIGDYDSTNFMKAKKLKLNKK
jgi:RHS repeat-associated protein